MFKKNMLKHNTDIKKNHFQEKYVQKIDDIRYCLPSVSCEICSKMLIRKNHLFDFSLILQHSRFSTLMHV